jgi:hypothetical protein
MVALDECNEDGVRYIRATEIESVSPHTEGSIIKTKSGDFHRTVADPETVIDAMRKAERN